MLKLNKMNKKNNNLFNNLIIKLKKLKNKYQINLVNIELILINKWQLFMKINQQINFN